MRVPRRIAGSLRGSPEVQGEIIMLYLTLDVRIAGGELRVNLAGERYYSVSEQRRPAGKLHFRTCNSSSFLRVAESFQMKVAVSILNISPA